MFLSSCQSWRRSTLVRSQFHSFIRLNEICHFLSPSLNPSGREARIYIQGAVKGSSVKLPDTLKVSDGSRVIVTILEPTTKIKDRLLSQELENEDLEFVRACRGRLAKQLQTDDD